MKPAQLLKIDDVADLTQLCVRTIRNLWYSGDFPAPIRIRRSIRWRLSDVQAYIDQQEQVPVKDGEQCRQSK